MRGRELHSVSQLRVSQLQYCHYCFPSHSLCHPMFCFFWLLIIKQVPSLSSQHWILGLELTYKTATYMFGLEFHTEIHSSHENDWMTTAKSQVSVNSFQCITVLRIISWEITMSLEIIFFSQRILLLTINACIFCISVKKKWFFTGQKPCYLYSI